MKVYYLLLFVLIIILLPFSTGIFFIEFHVDNLLFNKSSMLCKLSKALEGVAGDYNEITINRIVSSTDVRKLV